MTDPIADMLTRIRNSLVSRHNAVNVPMSGIKAQIARVLKEEGYISGYKFAEEGIKKSIQIELKYAPDKSAVIREIKRASKPGRRLYVNKSEIPRVRGGLGISILSTSKGIMTSTQARRLGIGGELLCTVL
ncbi:MAG: 30S ribosomal protein S8 [Deltaproteobacteria bacterium]